MCSERPVNSFRTKLISIVDDDYREFVTRGIPCDRPFLGVRIPEIRKLVKAIPPADFDEFLKAEPIAIEEVIARGFLIARLPYAEMLKHFDSQIKFLDNWCTVDTFVASLRKTIKHHELDFLDRKVEPLLKSRNEFAIRAGLVCLLDFYVDSDHLFLIFDRLEYLKEHDEYYVKMSLAWLLAECFIKYPDETFVYLQHSNLPKWTFNKAISKICDSHRVAPAAKSQLKLLRR
ncbi:DNA alkylation repair protein [Candidatus Saccharibacteria bacterium]|nr:DNA alkylation repair protein [Candidatus Saccharibacteria bacterium]MBR3595059.1 DNA alkylation repair protein [Candidatus Saccharibacteria bacterium]MBR6122423.1 DNA alkylation repair protein [Candidatus Saccharibacteria bacterium]